MRGASTRTSSGDWTTRVRALHIIPLRRACSHRARSFCTEATRYTNPIKRKYRQKRLAADGMCWFLTPLECLPEMPCSRWGRGRSSSKAPQRPDARRVPTPEQDSVLAEPPRDGHQGPAHGALLAVCRGRISAPSTCVHRFLPTDTQTCTKFVSSQQRRTLHSLSSWTSRVLR